MLVSGSVHGQQKINLELLASAAIIFLLVLCVLTMRHRFGGFPQVGVPFLGAHNKDYGILGSILGSPYLGKLPFTDAQHTSRSACFLASSFSWTEQRICQVPRRIAWNAGYCQERESKVPADNLVVIRIGRPRRNTGFWLLPCGECVGAFSVVSLEMGCRID